MNPPVRVPVDAAPVTVTTTFCAPAVPGGVVQVSEDVVETETPVHADPPIVTDVEPKRKLVPVIVTGVPPAVVPLVGLMAVTVGVEGVPEVVVTVPVAPGVLYNSEAAAPLYSYTNTLYIVLAVRPVTLTVVPVPL